MTSTRQVAVFALLSLAACSPSRLAENALASALSSGTGGTFQSDDDPQLVGQALPFALKLMESLAEDLPRHERLLRSLDSGFVGYAYAFVQEPADETDDADRAELLRVRARKLFLRARGYGLRALDVDHEGLGDALLSGDAKRRQLALTETTRDDVPDMYWTAAAWGLAIADAKDNLAMVGQLPAVAELAERALALDPDWDQGTLQAFFIAFDAARGKAAEAKKHYEKAVELDHGLQLGVRVSYAESVLVPAQDKAAFVKLLTDVVSFDVDRPDARKMRLQNVLAQRRAKWLLSRLDDLFV
ncbi:MAG: TRAP transporter TatT component family protein [Deltaproteobacteria bacterium]